jgi:hypothetical protein
MLVMTMGLVIVASQPFATIHSSAFHGQEWTIAVGGGRVRHAQQDSYRTREGQLQRLGVQSPQSFIQDQHGGWKLRSQRQHFLFPSTQIRRREHLV